MDAWTITYFAVMLGIWIVGIKIKSELAAILTVGFIWPLLALWVAPALLLELVGYCLESALNRFAPPQAE